MCKTRRSKRKSHFATTTEGKHISYCTTSKDDVVVASTDMGETIGDDPLFVDESSEKERCTIIDRFADGQSDEAKEDAVETK